MPFLFSGFDSWQTGIDAGLHSSAGSMAIAGLSFVLALIAVIDSLALRCAVLALFLTDGWTVSVNRRLVAHALAGLAFIGVGLHAAFHIGLYISVCSGGMHGIHQCDLRGSGKQHHRQGWFHVLHG